MSAPLRQAEGVSKHTPGPWLQNSTVLICTAEAKVVANCTPFTEIPQLAIPIMEVEANARLIAAAPELLQMLESVLPLLDGEHDGSQQYEDMRGYTADQVRAAIKKARGE